MIRLENLTKIYPDGTEALRNVSFKVEDGEFYPQLIGLASQHPAGFIIYCRERCLSFLNFHQGRGKGDTPVILKGEEAGAGCVPAYHRPAMDGLPVEHHGIALADPVIAARNFQGQIQECGAC